MLWCPEIARLQESQNTKVHRESKGYLARGNQDFYTTWPSLQTSGTTTHPDPRHHCFSALLWLTLAGSNLKTTSAAQQPLLSTNWANKTPASRRNKCLTSLQQWQISEDPLKSPQKHSTKCRGLSLGDRCRQGNGTPQRTLSQYWRQEFLTGWQVTHRGQRAVELMNRVHDIQEHVVSNDKLPLKKVKVRNDSLVQNCIRAFYWRAQKNRKC